MKTGLKLIESNRLFAVWEDKNRQVYRQAKRLPKTATALAKTIQRCESTIEAVKVASELLPGQLLSKIIHLVFYAKNPMDTRVTIGEKVEFHKLLGI